MENKKNETTKQFWSVKFASPRGGPKKKKARCAAMAKSAKEQRIGELC